MKAGAFVMSADNSSQMDSVNIRAVVFDVGEVLFHWDLRVLFSKVIPDPARLDFFLAEVLTFDFHLRHDAGEELADLVSELSDLHPEFSDAIDAYADRFNETITGPVAGAHQLVEALAARDVPLFGLTNFGKAFWAKFRPTQPVFDYFQDILVSGEEKLLKPDPAIYHMAEQRFGYAPGELLFADDRLENVEAARRCGWQAHHFTDAETFAKDLRARGLLG